MDGWVDFLQFYVHFNSNSVIIGRQEVDNEMLYAMEPRLRLERYPSPAGLEPGTASSAGQRLTYLATKQTNDGAVLKSVAKWKYCRPN